MIFKNHGSGCIDGQIPEINDNRDIEKIGRKKDLNFTWGQDTGQISIRGICFDDKPVGFPNVLTTAEIRSSLSAFSDFELISYHACVMSTIENVYDLLEYSNTVVCSEESTYSSRWHYSDIIDDVSTSTTPVQLSQIMVTECNTQPTLAAWQIGNTYLSSLSTNVSLFAQRMIDLFPQGLKTVVDIAYLNSRGFKPYLNWPNIYIDLRQFALQIASNSTDPILVSRANAVASSISNSYFRSSWVTQYENTLGGLSIYFPLNETDGGWEDYFTTGNLNFVSDVNQKWDDFLIVYHDSDPPICSFLQPGTGGWFSGNISCTASATDIKTNILYVEFQYSLDNSNWYPLPGPDSPDGKDWNGSNGWGLTFQTTSTPVNGIINDNSVWIRARACDLAGNISNWDACDNSIGVDNALPTGTITINDGNSITCLNIVSLSLSANDNLSGIAQMQLSNNGTTSWSAWEAYSAHRNWDLFNYGGNANPGNKTVYAKYRDLAGNCSEISFDNIEYQEQLAAWVSIATPVNSVCAGSSVLFTASVSNGGSSPGYQWKKGGIDIPGATNSTYSYIPLNNDVITCQMTSNLTCATGSPALSNAITITVNQPSAVSVSINASANNVCQGNSVTFTAAPVNGGSSPAYQWKKNNVNIGGATNSTYSYAPANNDVITCELTSNATCISNTTATSNPLNMVVIPSAPVSVSIAPSSNPVCSGSTVIFTATPTNGGLSPGYQWKKNNVNISGATNQTYSYIPTNGEVITCILNSNANCATGSPASSNAVTMVVNSALTAGITISPSSNPSCSGNTVLFTATPISGGSSPSYQWKKNNVNISGATNSTYSYIPLNNDMITCQMISSLACATGSPALSNAITMTVNQPSAVSVSINASANNVCQGISVTFTAMPVNGGTLPAYQWKKNGVNINGATGSTYSYAPANNDMITCELTSNATCISNTTATSNALNMVVIPSAPVSVSISPSANPVCSGTTVIYTATHANGGSSPGYQWKKNGIPVSGATNTTYSYIPANNDKITCTLTSNENCATGTPATSNEITMTVNSSLIAGIVISSSANPSCLGASVLFTASPTNGGSSPGYQWKKNTVNISGATNSTYSYIPLNNDVITCQMTSNLTCATGSPALSNAVIMTVNQPAAVSVSINNSSNNVCQGTSVTFSAIPVNGGSSPAYQWKKNNTPISGATNFTYSYAPANNDGITCELTSNATCIANTTATSNTITLVVIPSAPVSVLISPSSNPVCIGTQVTFAALSTNGGSSPGFQWKKNSTPVSGATNSTYSYIPTNNDVITCSLTSNANCATGSPAASNAVTMVVNASLPAGLTISASANPACAGTQVVFTATPANGGASPGYQWKKSGVTITGATNSTYSYTPANNDVITCSMNSSLSCASGNPATSNSITMSLNQPVPVSVSITASGNGVCQGTPVTFTATPVNGGSTPAYQWKKNNTPIPGATNSTYSYAPANNDAITCELASSATCIANATATSNMITMTVVPSAPVSIAITPSANPVCSGAAVTFTSAFVNGGIFPGFQWKKNGVAISGATNSTYTYTPANNDIITCVITSNEVCATGSPATSNAITISVTTSIPAGVSILASTNNVCAGTTVHFTAYPVNGGSSPNYQWKKNGIPVGSNQPTYSCVPQNFDVITCTLTSNLSCASGNPVTSNSVIMNITTPAVVEVLIYASANPSCFGAPVTYTATALNQGTAPVYRWMKNGVTVGSNSPAYSYIPEANDLITCELTSNATCIQNPTAISNVITTAITPSVPVSVSIIASANPVCSGTLVTFNATAINSGNSPLYQWKKNGTEIGSNNPVLTYAPDNGDIITCIMTSSVNCPAGSPATSNSIAMSVNTSLAAGITVVPSANPACEGDIITFTAAPVNGGTAPVYQWKVNNQNAGSNSASFAFMPVNGDVVQCGMTSNLGCATGNPALSNAVTMTVHQISAVGVNIQASANPVCTGSSVTFSANPVNGGTSPGYQWMKNGVNVGADNPVYSCIPQDNDIITCILTSSEPCIAGNPVTSNSITMTVNPNLAAGIAITASENPVCSGTPVTYTAASINGGSLPAYQWRVNNNLVGTNQPSYTYTPSDGDLIVCDLVSNAACVTGNPATSNGIPMTVANQLSIGLTITAASSTVCIGSPAYFTAHPVNGGLTPVFQWRVNGINTPATGPNFSYVPANGDVVSCEMTSGISCATNNPVFSNSIGLSTVPPVPVSVSITVPQTTVCEGRPVTYTAFHINGGPSPSFQWKVNGVNAGTNNQFFTYVPSNGDVIHCVLTTSLTCVTNVTTTSNSILMTVDPLQPVSLAITPSANPVLPGTAVTFTATWTNGGSSPVFQWKVNGINVGNNHPVFTYIPSDQDVVVCEMTTDILCVTVNPVISNQIQMTVTSLPVGVSIVCTANDICAGSYIEFTATPVNGGTDPHYQWKVNGVDAGTNSPSFGYTPLDQDIVTCVLTSNEPFVTGNPATSNPLNMIVNPNIPVSVTISPDVNPVCPQSQVTLSAIPVNGGTTPFYQWKVNGINSGVSNPAFTYFPSNGDIVVCRLTSSEECTDENPVMSNGITMQVLTVIPVGLTIGASANPVNSGIPVTFTANPVNPGNAPFFQWKVNGVDRQNNNPVFSYTPADGDQIVCLMTSGHSCASVNPAVSNTIIMTVNIVPAITVMTPDGGEYWIQGSVQNITWTDNISENVKIELLKGGIYFETLVSSTPSTGSWSWTIPADQQVGIDYQIRITSVSNNSVTDISNATFKIMANVVSNLVVQNMEISNGSINCFDALNTITVAGNGSFFHVTKSSFVTFIAGMNILFLPGTHIHDNGMMHGYIAPTGPFCGVMPPSFIQVTASEEEPVLPSKNPRILIYPNPSTGKITLEFVPENLRSGARICIYSMNGATVLQKELPTMQKETFTLDFLPPGIYLCRILYDGKQELVKIVLL